MPSVEELRDRELEILRLVATGASNKEIASQLNISTNTVKVHLRNIFAKIGVSSRTEAAMFAVSNGLVPEVGQAVSQPLDEELSVAGLDDSAGSLLAPDSSSARPLQPRPALGLWVGAIALLVVAIGLGAWWLTSVRSPALQPTPLDTPETSNWESLTPLSSPRSGLALVAVEGRIYAIGGESDEGITGAVESYDFSANRWSTASPKPLPVKDAGAVVIAGKVYVPGGTTASGETTDILEIYDPARNEWEAGASMPAGISAYALVAFDGDLFVFGGWDGRRAVNTVYKYTPGDDAWDTLRAMPTARRYLGAAVSGRRIYVLGGENESGPLRVNEVFSPDQTTTSPDPWQTGDPLPEPRLGMGVASIADIIYVIGGNETSASKYSLLTYDEAGGWRSVEAFSHELATFHGLTGLGKYLYIAGGEVDENITGDFIRYQAVYTISFPIIVR